MEGWDKAWLSLWERDWLWWPLVSLRPPREHNAGALLVIGLAALGTLVACGAFGFVYMLRPQPIAMRYLAMALAACFVVALALLGFTFALPWNRRARRLRPA